MTEPTEPAEPAEPAELPSIDHTPSTENEFNLIKGENLSNHSTSLAGRGKFVRQGNPVVPTFRTRQAAYRYAARLIELAGNHLPDESATCAPCTFEAVRAAMIEEGVK